MKVKIEIETSTFVRFWLVVIGFATAILLIWLASPALIVIGIALFLALALNPPVSRLASVMPGKSRIGATAIAYLIVISALGAFLFTVIPPVIDQSAKLAQEAPTLIDQVSSQRVYVNDFVDRYNLGDQVDQAINNAKVQANNAASNLGNIIVSGVGTVLNGAITLLIILVLTFLMLIEGPKWLERLWGLYNNQERLERHRSLVERMYRVVTGYVNGQLVVAAIASICAMVVILVLSFSFGLTANIALPLGAIVFLFGLIPAVGATLSAIVVTIVLLFNSVPAALIFLAYFVVYQQIENNFISPTIQSRAVELSTLAILSAILIGGTLFGFLGVLIAIPIAGCVRVLLVDYLQHAERQRQKSSNPVKRLAAKLKHEEV